MSALMMSARGQSSANHLASVDWSKLRLLDSDDNVKPVTAT
jgi:hypothetical protein